MQIPLDKETFVEYMKFIDEQNTLHCEINKLMQQAYTDVIFYPTGKYEEMLVSLLEEIMNDVGKDISYFIYELDFGRNWEAGAVTENDVDVKLATPEDLYDHLITKLVDTTE